MAFGILDERSRDPSYYHDGAFSKLEALALNLSAASLATGLTKNCESPNHKAKEACQRPRRHRLRLASILQLSQISASVRLIYHWFTGKAVGIFDFFNLTCSLIISRSYAFNLHHHHNHCHPPQCPDISCPFCQANLSGSATLAYGTQIFGGVSPSITQTPIRSLNHPTILPAIRQSLSLLSNKQAAVAVLVLAACQVTELGSWRCRRHGQGGENSSLVWWLYIWKWAPVLTEVWSSIIIQDTRTCPTSTDTPKIDNQDKIILNPSIYLTLGTHVPTSLHPHTRLHHSSAKALYLM